MPSLHHHRSRIWAGQGALALALACNAPSAAPTPDPAPAKAQQPAAPPDTPLTESERAAAGRILFIAEREGNATIDQIFPSGQGYETLLAGKMLHEGPAVFTGPVSPDGALVTIITVDEESVHLERVEVRPLSEGGALGEPLWRSDPAPQVRNVSWAPDGRFLAFEASFSSFRDLYRLDLPPGTDPKLTRLTDHPAGNYEPAISPDGRRIAFVSSRDDNAEVYVMHADGSEPKRLTNFHLDDWGPQWSPDGRTLAFLSNREGVDRIFLCNADGTDLRRLTRDTTTVAKLGVEPGEAEPTFSPDGRSLVFSTRTGINRAALRLVDLQTGALTELTPGTHSDRSPVWSPTGSLLVFASDRDGDPELYLMRRDGTGVARLTARPGADWLPRWAPR